MTLTFIVNRGITLKRGKKRVVTAKINKVFSFWYDWFIFPIPILLEKKDDHKVYQWISCGILIQEEV